MDSQKTENKPLFSTQISDYVAIRPLLYAPIRFGVLSVITVFFFVWGLRWA
jgi:hypothetical protein